MEERSDQVLTKVKVVVVHARRHDQTAGAAACIVQVLRVLTADERVLHAVHYEGGRAHFLDRLDVSEAVLYQILEQAASLVLCNSPDGLERRHEKKSSGLPQACQVRRRTTAHAATKHDDVLLVHSKHLIDVVINVHSVVQDVLLVRFEDVLAPRLIYFGTLTKVLV